MEPERKRDTGKGKRLRMEFVCGTAQQEVRKGLSGFLNSCQGLSYRNINDSGGAFGFIRYDLFTDSAAVEPRTTRLVGTRNSPRLRRRECRHPGFL